jgi:hypothetical protein
MEDAGVRGRCGTGHAVTMLLVVAAGDQQDILFFLVALLLPGRLIGNISVREHSRS